MLESLAAWFLNNYLGKYLENLNTDQLSIALLQGEVELENVPLRRDALRFLNASLDVRAGVVGRIKLRIPVSRLRSEPWHILMERVHIVTGPQRFDDFDADQEESLTQELKLAALDGIETEWRTEHDRAGTGSSAGYYPSYASWMSYGTSFIGTIVENLQIEIRDVHVRYEDESALPRPFACGFYLESLAAQTCDELWNPRFVHRDPSSQKMAFKMVQLQNMAAYLDLDMEAYGDLEPEELAVFLTVSLLY